MNNIKNRSIGKSRSKKTALPALVALATLSSGCAASLTEMQKAQRETLAQQGSAIVAKSLVDELARKCEEVILDQNSNPTLPGASLAFSSVEEDDPVRRKSAKIRVGAEMEGQGKGGVECNCSDSRHKDVEREKGLACSLRETDALGELVEQIFVEMARLDSGSSKIPSLFVERRDAKGKTKGFTHYSDGDDSLILVKEDGVTTTLPLEDGSTLLDETKAAFEKRVKAWEEAIRNRPKKNRKR